MSMSKDRVRFTIRRDKAIDMAEVMKSAFDLRCHQIQSMRGRSGANGYEYITIVCRPSQFGRFIVHRCNLGYENLVRELQAELFTPAPDKPQVLDVSKNPNTWAAPEQTVDGSHCD